MPNILRNILVLFAGLLLGGIVNGAIVSFGIVPEGVDPNNLDDIRANMHLYKPLNFLVPFLAHAIGTLVGAMLAAKFATEGWKLKLALVVGFFFLIGGSLMVKMIPETPLWFILVDLGLAYIPMAGLGYRIGTKIRR